MLKILIKKRHVVFISTLFIAIIATAGGIFAMGHFGEQAIARQVSESNKKLDEIDKKIAELRAQKIAEQKAKAEAERKAKEKAKKTAEQTAAAQAALLAQLAGQVVTPAGCTASGPHSTPSNIDVLINKKRCFNPINYVPKDRVYYQGYPVSNKIYANLVAMINAAATSGKTIGLTSGYRSYDNQVSTYNYWVGVNGSTAAADKVSARPGYSEHQTGFAVDLDGSGSNLSGFAGTTEYTWMKNNGYKYGFIQRYKSGYEEITGYSAEAWHWRYVGKTVATDMRNKGIHTLEQYWNIEGGGY